MLSILTARKVFHSGAETVPSKIVLFVYVPFLPFDVDIIVVYVEMCFVINVAVNIEEHRITYHHWVV